jgi:hypothetical protein
MAFRRPGGGPMRIFEHRILSVHVVLRGKSAGKLA